MCGDGGGGGGEGACEPGYEDANSQVGAPVGGVGGSSYGDYFCGGPGGDPGDWP